MLKKNKHGGAAVLVFFALSALFWFAVKEPSGFSGKACREEEQKPAHEHEENSHNEAAADLDGTKKVTCEHGIQTIDCDKCRFELGAVRIEPSLAKSLISTGKLEERPAQETLSATGEVQFDLSRVVDVHTPSAGRIIHVSALLGQQVRKGDTLATIYSADLADSKAAYLKAKAELEIAQYAQERQTTLNSALERLLKRLAKGEEMVTESGELLGEWKSKLGNAQARLKLAASVYEREKDLWGKQISSKLDYETAQQGLKSAQADYSALLEEIQLNLKVSKLQSDNAVKKAQMELATTAQRLHTLGLDEASVLALSDQRGKPDLALLEIKAPRTGTITAQNITEGKMVDSVQALYTIADLSNLWVWCNVYEKDIARLDADLSGGKFPQALVKVAAFPDKTFSGRLDLIGSAVDEHTRTIKVRIQVGNDQGKLRPGMFANVEILTAACGKMFTLPQEAVLSDEGKSFVFQHLKDDLWMRKDVKIGRKQGQQLEILGGIDKNAMVITGGAFMLKSDILREKMGAGCAD